MIDRLLAHPRRFGFFQAVRLLERERRHRAPVAAVAGVTPGDGRLAEPALFRVEPSLAFPPTEIASIRLLDGDEGRQRHLAELVVSFFGLTGPSGVLPQYYTAQIIGMRSRSRALRDFLDLFNHRLIALFADAWAKYRLPIAFERRAPRSDDPITAALRGIIGFPTDPLRGRIAKTDDWVLHYGGLFAHTVRSAAGLEAMLGDYFRVPIAVAQFIGRWLTLAAGDRTALPGPGNRYGSYCTLDENATLGDRFWDVQGCFRLVIGPLDYREFLRFMPPSGDFPILLELAHLYVGHSLDFDVQLILRREEVPALQLSRADDFKPLLGWNTWLPVQGRNRDANDAVFGGKLVVLDRRASVDA